MRIDAGARTDLGRVRKNNEDSFEVLPELGLYILSDGMGGEAHGEIASRMAVEAIAQHCRDSLLDPKLPLLEGAVADLGVRTNRLASSIQLANRMIYESAQKHPAQRGMGATVVAVWLDGSRMSLAHVGDSRAYRLRGGALEQLTQDHSLVAEQVRRGILTQQQADESEMQSVLIRALGIDATVQVDADEHTLIEGDTLLLCSDGLSRMVTDAGIASALLTSLNSQEAVDRMIEAANDAGGEDNVTAVAIRIVRESHGPWTRFMRWLGGSGS
ncbi:MAG: Stp1/IreP family PP2C-type Ser/Thr phosphatase [Acidipila sp.]|nr:Stp1/IreP family PP2C-type Ser/Thr phosphatase [Acidipila sp.]